MARFKTEEILEQFIKTHGNRYDYSRVEYTHSQTKVKIICRTHGEFEQLVGMHRKGQGCAKCMHDSKRHSKEAVIASFRRVHLDRYNYSLVDYINTDTKVKILCVDHGVFEQAPEKHLQGNGCPKCIGRHKTQSDILSEFRLVHGDRYDYSEVEYKYALQKVSIICREHGVFRQTPQNHSKGQGCPICAGTSKHTLQDVIEQFRSVHGDRYDYSLVDYINSKTKIKIICQLHGMFEQEVFSHKSGCGCPYCAGNYNLSTHEVIEQFVEVHGDRYDYSKVNYIQAFGKVEIICREHGLFTQSAKNHKDGSGCPDCAVTIGHTKASYVEYCALHGGTTNLYLIKCRRSGEQFYKIGIARLGVEARFDSKRKMPYEFEVLEQISGDASYIWDLEKRIHGLLGKFKYKPKLDFHGKTECFRSVPRSVYTLLKEINKNLQIELIT